MLILIIILFFIIIILYYYYTIQKPKYNFISFLKKYFSTFICFFSGIYFPIKKIRSHNYTPFL